jgi:SAM-dependent methyltransferase
MCQCRICGSKNTVTFLNLGPTPLANSFLTPDSLNEPEDRFPLDVEFCPQCGLVQLDHVVPPEVMFRDYIYVSSTSQTMPAHFAGYADEIVTRFLDSSHDLVLEIGSNDGCLLRALQTLHVQAIGMEPAVNLASIANATGTRTVNDFFCERSAREFRSREGAVKVVIGNNVLAHVGDLQNLVAGLDLVLRPDGIAVFEVPYLIDLLRKTEFDTIYHEHLYYFALRPLQRLFESRGMRIFDVKRLFIHGGSIRLYVCRTKSEMNTLPTVDDLLRVEQLAKLERVATYTAFADQVLTMKRELRALLSELKASGARIAAYGAPAKGNTLLNHFSIGSDIIDFVVDRSPYKQGMYTPGTHLPIVKVERLLDEQPDYVLLLAWNFLTEICEQQSEYLNRGGKFIIPIPTPKVLTRDCVTNETVSL